MVLAKEPTNKSLGDTVGLWLKRKYIFQMMEEKKRHSRKHNVFQEQEKQNVLNVGSELPKFSCLKHGSPCGRVLTLRDNTV
jgi:hypothetical protein